MRNVVLARAPRHAPRFGVQHQREQPSASGSSAERRTRRRARCLPREAVTRCRRDRPAFGKGGVDASETPVLSRRVRGPERIPPAIFLAAPALALGPADTRKPRRWRRTSNPRWSAGSAARGCRGRSRVRQANIRAGVVGNRSPLLRSPSRTSARFSAAFARLPRRAASISCAGPLSAARLGGFGTPLRWQSTGRPKPRTKRPRPADVAPCAPRKGDELAVAAAGDRLGRPAAGSAFVRGMPEPTCPDRADPIGSC